MITPDKAFKVLFKSIIMPDPAQQWDVHVMFPAQATDDSMLSLYASDWDGVPIVKGTFECLGGRWKIEGGRGEMPCSGFIKGIREKKTAVWFCRPGQEPVPGGLTFG